MATRNAIPNVAPKPPQDLTFAEMIIDAVKPLHFYWMCPYKGTVELLGGGGGTIPCGTSHHYCVECQCEILS